MPKVSASCAVLIASQLVLLPSVVKYFPAFPVWDGNSSSLLGSASASLGEVMYPASLVNSLTFWGVPERLAYCPSKSSEASLSQLSNAVSLPEMSSPEKWSR